jgi:L-fuculose-phosphate aldolase
MTIQEAKETVVIAGRRLVESGLIARTWGNVSCRISDSHFVITPSGRDYLSLAAEEIVEVAISDCSYQGDVKPSSEKGIHAEVYQLHPKVNFVIHTHQEYASSVSVLGLDIVKVSESYPLLHGEVICAAYGLPGTKGLRKGVASALSKAKGNAVIMKNHGALCYGSDEEEAFQTANELEQACRQFILDQYHKKDDNTIIEPLRIGRHELSHLFEKDIISENVTLSIPFESERIADGFLLKSGDATYEFITGKLNNLPKADPSLLKEALLHHQIYRTQENVHYILHADTLGIATVSSAAIKVLPLLDDFAQIAGTSVNTADMDANEVSAKLKGSSAVFLKCNGALCCGANKGDALAVSMVTEKNCNALISAALFGKVTYIKHWECILMRYVYLKKYSKQAYKI